MLELVGDFFGRKKECVGAGISGGGPPGAHEAGARPGPSWPGACSPDVFSVPNILKYSKKIIFKFQGIWRTFIFEVFLYCTDNQITERKIFIFILFNINIRK